MKGFAEFIRKGNLVQLAVAFVMGVAFAAVVNSFVKDLISPLLGLFGGVNFADKGACIKGTCGTTVDPTTHAITHTGVFLGWGAFLTALLAFVITAAVLYYFVVKPYERLEKVWTKDEEDAGPSEVDLLTEIRDALRDGSTGSSTPSS